MKKVLFMMSSMNIGGVEKSLLSLLAVIPREKYDVTLLLLEKKGEFLEYIPDWVKVEEASWFKKVRPIIMQPPQDTVRAYRDNKEYKKIPGFIGSYFLSKKLNDRYMYYRHVLKDTLAHQDPYDVAIAYQGPTDIIDFYITTKVTAKKKISWVHFDVSKHAINQKFYNKMHRNFNKVFVVSEEAKEKLIEMIPTDKNKAEVILNIISPRLINQMSLEKAEFAMDSRAFKVVTVGRLSKEKGQDIAIKVLARLKEDGYNVMWYCIGEGAARKEYEELIEVYGLNGNFILLGAVKNPYPYIKNADIYVQTSRHEGYCLSLAEAKCLGKPIITTKFTGASEQIVNGYNGLLVNFNEEELYEKVKYLIEHPEQKERLAKNSAGESIDTTKEATKLIKYVG